MRASSLSIAGYTLIEVLVVLFIMGLVTGIAILKISYHTDRAITAFSNELAQVLILTEERALLESKTLGIVWHNHDYQVVRLSLDKWQPFNDRYFQTHDIPNTLLITLSVNRHPVNTHASDRTNEPSLATSADGAYPPFVIYIGQHNKKPCYKITNQTNG